MSADERGLEVARKFAAWNLGHPSWADAIIRAYFNPDEVEAALRKDKEAAS